MHSKSRESGGLTTVVWCVALYSCILEFSELNDSYLKDDIYKFTVNLLRALKQMQITGLTIHSDFFSINLCLLLHPVSRCSLSRRHEL